MPLGLKVSIIFFGVTEMACETGNEKKMYKFEGPDKPEQYSSFIPFICNVNTHSVNCSNFNPHIWDKERPSTGA